ncbi:EAL domain-containing protein [Clostridium sp. 19966]|uniref:EAL domain-containing protein n=1 Tax=Clostridium sp. 19966 TaxID=2768166 RepID=UPI0028DE0818|nr:EAL domain-containing protein [Clostridium sp. 19966]MDT8719564.1 EAL domain-containing protein [Clostridium sp. 19966]
MNLKIYNFINSNDLNVFLNKFNDFCGINCMLIDLNGDILIERDIKNACWHSSIDTADCKSCFKHSKEFISQLKPGDKFICSQCSMGLTAVYIPIYAKNDLLAYLYCGEFSVSPSNNQDTDTEAAAIYNSDNINSVYNISSNRLKCIIDFMVLLAKSIETFISSELENMQLNEELMSNYEKLESTYEELLAAEDELKVQFAELQDNKNFLEQSEERYKLALNSSHDGIWDWDITNNNFYYSERWANMLGYTKHTLPLKNTSWRSLIHPEDLEIFDININNYISKISDKYKCEYRIKKSDETYIWISDAGSASWDSSGHPVRIVGCHTDITEQKNLSEKVNKLAYLDTLTELPNMHSLYTDLNELCSNKLDFSVVFLDIDNFKSINDTLSHSFGDKLLKKLCFTFSSLNEDNSSLYRWGGDEFIYVLRYINNETLLSEFMEKIVKSLSSPIIIDEVEIYVTASIGGCIYPAHGNTSEDLIKNSDTAMFRAKSLGKNNYQIYNENFSLNVIEQANLDRDLRIALKNNEFQVYYQPRVNVESNHLVGMEALIRWVKPDGSIISPLKFIPKAEETGLIIPIGHFVLKETCRQMKEWIYKGYDNITVSVNLSAKQIEDPNLINTIKSCIEEASVPYSCIELEITESAAIKDMNQTISLLKELKAIGINVLLDDFGTGYSSLNFLRLLPVTTIKIDKSFIDKVEEETAEKTIVSSIISLAHDIRLRVIAEGIENLSQLDFLQKNSCDEAQGYYFSKPVPAEIFEKLLENRNNK